MRGVPGRFKAPGLRDEAVEVAMWSEDVETDLSIHPMFRLGAELLKQAVVDAAHALKAGAVNPALVRCAGKLELRAPSSVAKCSMLEAVEACRFLTNGTAQAVLNEMEALAGRSCFTADYLLRQVRKMASVRNYRPRKHEIDIARQFRKRPLRRDAAL